MVEKLVVAYGTNKGPEDIISFKSSLKRIAAGAWKDFKTTNDGTGGKLLKFLAGSTTTSYFARTTGTLSPIAWAFTRLGPLPMEFTTTGSIRVFTLTAF